MKCSILFVQSISNKKTKSFEILRPVVNISYLFILISDAKDKWNLTLV
jgi:hypothetical protein